MSALPEPAPTSASEHHVHVLRSRGSVLLGGVGAIGCLVLLFASMGAGLVYVAAVALGGVLCVVLLVRPCVRVSIEGVSVHNPFRRTFVPWQLVEDVTSRWNLQLYAGAQVISAWAISAHIDRPCSLTPFGLGESLANRSGAGTSRTVPGSAHAPAPAGEGRMTAARAARLIETAREEWADAVADGVVVAPSDPQVARSWEWLDLVLVAVPAALLAFGLFMR